MYRKFLVYIFLIASSFVYGQGDYSTTPQQRKLYESTPSIILKNPKNQLYKTGDYWGVIYKYVGITGVKEKNPIILYNIAASYDKLEMLDEAMHYLYMFMDVSQDDREILFSNDFPNLKSCADKWEKITQRIDSLFLSTIGDVENKELALKIFHVFIDKRKQVALPADTTIPIHKQQRPQYEKETDNILKTYGFPTEKMVGRYAVFCVYDIIHHANLLEKHYPKVKKIFEKGEFDSILYALMTDRVLCDKNKKQLYGTQWALFTFGFSKGEFKKYVKKYPDKCLLQPVEDFKNLNERRKQMGFKETIEEMMEAYKDENYFIPPEYYEENKSKNK